jgi:CHAT domain-containing protein
MQAQGNVGAFAPQQIKLLAIAAENARDSNMPSLRYVREETRRAADIATHAGASVSCDADALSKSGVLALLDTANMVHLACHGIQDATKPHASRFCLSTGDLSVSELMEMNLKHAFVAFLSACETAQGAKDHADEVVHLAATMLFVGFKSVIATMW